jgi:hypothetical protein
LHTVLQHEWEVFAKINCCIDAFIVREAGLSRLINE